VVGDDTALMPHRPETVNRRIGGIPRQQRRQPPPQIDRMAITVCRLSSPPLDQVDVLVESHAEAVACRCPDDNGVGHLQRAPSGGIHLA
jgi:hypothetical protein